MTAAEYFGRTPEEAKAAREAGRRSMQQAHRDTGVAYGTIHAAKSTGKATAPLAQKLQDWSLPFAEECGAYISAPKTLGVSEPSVHEIRKAAGE